MKKILPHLVIFCVSLLCPAILIYGNYLIDKSTDQKRQKYENNFSSPRDSLIHDTIRFRDQLKK